MNGKRQKTVILALIAAVAATATWYSVRAAHTAEVQHLNMRGALELARARSTFWQMSLNAPQLLLGNEATKHQLVADEPRLIATIDAALLAYEASEPTATAKTLFKALRQQFHQFVDSRPQLFALALAGKAEPAKEWIAAETAPRAVATFKAFAELIESHAKTSDDELVANAAQATAIRALLLGLCQRADRPGQPGLEPTHRTAGGTGASTRGQDRHRWRLDQFVSAQARRP